MTARREILHDLTGQVVALLARDSEHPALQRAVPRGDGEVELSPPVALAALVARAARLALRMRALEIGDRRVALAVQIGDSGAALYLACQLAGIAPAMLPVPAGPADAPAFAAVVASLARTFAPEVVVFDRSSFELVHAAGLLERWRGDAAAEVSIDTELDDHGGAAGEVAPLLAELRIAERDLEQALDAPAHYLFTSGTTGPSKVVRLSRRAVVRNTRYVADRWEFGAGDRLPVVGAPYHSGGLMVGLIMPLYMGATAVVVEEATAPAGPQQLLRAVASAGCTHLVGGDGLFRALMLDTDDVVGLRYPALRRVVIGGEPLGLPTLERVARHFAPRADPGLRICTAYGMTEAAGLISTSTVARPSQLWLRRDELDRGRIAIAAAPGDGVRELHAVISCGMPSHGTRVRVVDAAGRPLGDDTIGRVELASDSLFDGYLSDPASAGAAELSPGAANLCAVAEDGARYLATGDLGFRHAGEIFVLGRLKEAIPVGDALVAAERLETIARGACVAAAGHHGIAAVAVTHAGAPGNGVPSAFVEIVPGEILMMQEVAVAADGRPSSAPGAAPDREVDAGDPLADTARAIAGALLAALPLPACRVVLFAPGALPRKCTSAKKVRLPAAELLARGELAPLGSWWFAAPAPGATRLPAREPGWTAPEAMCDPRWKIAVPPSVARAVAEAAGTGTGPAELTASVRGVLERARLEVGDGLGFAVVSGLPSALPLDALERMVIAIGEVIGHAMPQNPMGECLTHVRDRGRDPGARGYLSNQALAFHSDTTDVLALFCVRAAAAGGDNVLVSSLRVFHELADLDAGAALDTLRTGFVYAYPDGGDTGRAASRMPVFSERGGRISCRYLRAFVELAAQRDGRVLDKRERRALDLFDEIAARPELQLRLRLEPGDLLLLNNHTVLHARTAFEDAEDTAGHRLLLRLWLEVPRLRPVIRPVRLLARRFSPNPNPSAGLGLETTDGQ